MGRLAARPGILRDGHLRCGVESRRPLHHLSDHRQQKKGRRMGENERVRELHRLRVVSGGERARRAKARNAYMKEALAKRV